MRILLVTQVILDRPHGGARHVLSVSRELAKLGHDVTLLAPGLEAPAPGVTRIRPSRRSHPGVRLEAELARLTVEHALRHRPDIAYVRLSPTSSLVPLSLSALSIPIVLELNGRILDELRERKRGALAVRVARRSLSRVVRLSRALVAVEPRIATHAERELGARETTVIENGADLDVATPGDREEACRALGLDADRTHLVLAGTLGPELRLDLLVDAHRSLDGVTLVVVGDGPGRATVEAARTLAGSSSPIVVLGAVPHEHAILAIRAADACVNVRDGDLGMKCLEYAAVGRRFATFRVEGAERLERLYPGLSAVHLVEERSARALSQAIARALEAEATFGPLPSEAVLAARRSLGWEHTAKRIAEVLSACA